MLRRYVTDTKVWYTDGLTDRNRQIDNTHVCIHGLIWAKDINTFPSFQYHFSSYAWSASYAKTYPENKLAHDMPLLTYVRWRACPANYMNDQNRLVCAEDQLEKR